MSLNGPTTARRDISRSRSSSPSQRSREAGGGSGGWGVPPSAPRMRRTPSNKLYRQIIENEVATNPEDWDVWDSKSPVRLLSIRHLGLLSSIPGSGYYPTPPSDSCEAAAVDLSWEAQTCNSYPSSPCNTLPKDFHFAFRYPMENGTAQEEVAESPTPAPLKPPCGSEPNPTLATDTTGQGMEHNNFDGGVPPPADGITVHVEHTDGLPHPQENNIPPPTEFQQPEPTQSVLTTETKTQEGESTKTVHSTESSEFSTSRDVVEKDDHTEIHLHEKRVVNLQESQEIVREYKTDGSDVDFEKLKAEFAKGGGVVETSEVKTVESFSRVEVQREEHIGDKIKSEEYVEQRHTKEELVDGKPTLCEIEESSTREPKPESPEEDEAPPPLPDTRPPTAQPEVYVDVAEPTQVVVDVSGPTEAAIDVGDLAPVEVQAEATVERLDPESGSEKAPTPKGSPSKSRKFFAFFHRKDKSHKDKEEPAEEKEPEKEEKKEEEKVEEKEEEKVEPKEQEKVEQKEEEVKVEKEEEKEKEKEKEGEHKEGTGTRKRTRGIFKKFGHKKEPKKQKEEVVVAKSATEIESAPPTEAANTSQEQSLTPDTSMTSQQSSPTPQSEHKEIFINISDKPKSLTLPGKSPTVTAVTAGPSYSKPGNTRTLGVNDSFDSAIARSSRSSVDSGTASDPSRVPGHFVVVAIDFGTTFSGYAFSFTRDPDHIHMMRKWEGGDPGVINQKTPTSLLLDSECKFHSFGFTARDFYHDLDPLEARKWLYFEKFKMSLHYCADLNKDTQITAANGMEMSAMVIFSHALRYMKEHALMELSDQSATKILNEDVRWVLTVPAIWKAPAKQFMREAAYNAGIACPEYPEQLLIALEPEAASIYVRKLRMHQLVPDRPHRHHLSSAALSPGARRESTPEPMNLDRVIEEFHSDASSPPPLLSTSSSLDESDVYPINPYETVGADICEAGTRYMVVDCGGGTVDITVHEMETKYGNLRELYKATGGPFGSVGVDLEFEHLLVAIFGQDYIDAFRHKRPAGWVDLMIAFESRKRAASPYKNNPLNVSLPFSFIDYHKKFRGQQVETVVRKFGDKEVRWSSQGMMRLTPDAMKRLFAPTLEKIQLAVGEVLNNPTVRDINYLFLVGGFSESAILQHHMRREFGHLLKIIIPQDVALTILKGAVCFGLDPTVVNVRKSRMTYGVGVLNRYQKGKHPKDKLVKKDGIEWCTDVFDKFVSTDQSMALGDTVLRSYTPAKTGQKSSIINIFCTENPNPTFITEKGVKKIGTLCLDLTDTQYLQNMPKRREIQTRMIFGDTEIKVSALDVTSGKCVRSGIDFLNK